MKLPEKESLVRQTIHVLQEMICSGELPSPIPGERTLANTLQVGRDTLRAALNELTRQQWISPSAQGKRREVLKTDAIKAGSKPTQQRVIFISPQPLEQIPRLMLVELDAFRALLTKRSITVEVLTPSIFETAQPEKRLEQLVADYPAAAWILYRCTEPVQRWFQQKQLRCIVRGYPHPSIDLPYLDEDWSAAAYHAGTRLLSHGHNSIGLVIPDSQLEGLKAAETGLRNALSKASDEHTLHLIQEKRDLHSVIQSVQKALATDKPPTALVVTRSRHVLNLISWLASFGYSIPEHLSVIALCHEPWFDDLYSPVTHYNSSPENMGKTLAKQVRHLINGEPLSSANSYIIPEHIEGQSIKDIKPPTA